MSTLETLTKARELIADPDHWTKGVLARDDLDITTSTTSENACKWCSVGAVDAVCGDDYDAYYDAVGKLNFQAVKRGYDFVAELNDSTNHATVLEMFDDAIKDAQCKN